MEPTADGYEVPRGTERIGTVTPDALEPNYPEPATDDPEEGGGA
ncbi:hypothetical protein [Paenibacillus sp. 1A_MP2]